ncbi:MAG TPA: hypothetical protein VL137_05355 [Polyangiaceae bacterium]|nr:hypothetical protein [Polyangiaceae bacterium]
MNPNQIDPREPDAQQYLERGVAFIKRTLRYWPTALIALLLGALAATAFLMVRVPKFRSETVILYVEQGSPIETSDAPETPRNVTVRLKELLLSRPKLERIIADFGLYPAVQNKYGALEAVEEFKRHIDFRAPGGDTFSIAYEGSSPTEAQRVTEELAHVVLQGDSDLRNEQAHVALDFLTSEEQQTESQLHEAEQKLAAFMALHPRFALDTTPLVNGAAIRASIGGTGGASSAGGSVFHYRRHPLGNPTSSAGAASVPNSAPASAAEDLDPAQARAALAAARESLAEALTRYTPAHPDVRAAQSAVARAEQRLDLAERSAAQMAPTVSADPAPPVASGEDPHVFREASPQKASAAAPAPPADPKIATGGGANVVEMETEWLNLTRAVTEARQRHDQVETQLFKADILASSEGGGKGVQVSVIDPAYLPQRPLPPTRTTVLLMFMAGSLLIGIAVAIARATLDERLLKGNDFEGIAELLVEVPKPSTGRRAHDIG